MRFQPVEMCDQMRYANKSAATSATVGAAMAAGATAAAIAR